MESYNGVISNRSVDAIPIPASGETRLWDEKLSGFLLRVYPTGRKVYALKYRLGRAQRMLTIGRHGSPWTPQQARDAAQNALDRVRAGEDPNDAKKREREAFTVSGLIALYLEEGPATKPAKRDTTWMNDASNLNRHIDPLLGKKIANLVTKADASRSIRDITVGKTAADERTTKPRGRAIIKGGAGVARRTLITAAAMYSWGIEYGHVAVNPFSSIKLGAPPIRERFLSGEEAEALLDATALLESTGEVPSSFADAIRMLMLTGARKTEILGLRWSEVHSGRSQLVLPPARTKSGGHSGERYIPLSSPALTILEKRLETATRDAEDAAKADGGKLVKPVYVFPAPRSGGPIVGLQKHFKNVIRQADIEDCRVHDLRHSFASFAIADGASLFLVGKILGHSTTRTTERYAHLSNEPLLAITNAVGKRFEKAASPLPETVCEVVELRRA